MIEDGYEKDDKRVTLHIRMRTTPAQALALQAMFGYWNWLAGIGSSRMVAFYVDGDGNFKPNIETNIVNPYGVEMPKLTDELARAAVVDWGGDEIGNRKYDFDPVAWKINTN